jgi:hypothetical protein
MDFFSFSCSALSSLPTLRSLPRLKCLPASPDLGGLGEGTGGRPELREANNLLWKVRKNSWRKRLLEPEQSHLSEEGGTQLNQSLPRVRHQEQNCSCKRDMLLPVT